MNDLEDGFYWVRYGDDWRIAERDSGYWWNPGFDHSIDEGDFDEIDPRRIVREGGETK